MRVEPIQLPRLLYVGDVPVQATVGGSLLLYRLLGDYPTGRLSIAEGGGMPSREDSRAPSGKYYTVKSELFPRLAPTRLRPAWKAAHFLAGFGAPWLVCLVEELARNCESEAILTVAHGHLWLAAARAAKQLKLPLHLIVHDDPGATMSIPPAINFMRQCSFGAVYRGAASRLCVSPGMVEMYEEEFGQSGKVLYPCRGEESPVLRVRTGGSVRENATFVIAYAGSLWSVGYQELLRTLAHALGPLGGRIDLYVPPETASHLSRTGFAAENMKFCGFLPPAILAETIADSGAVALFSPASFETDERQAIQTLFPSKIADYTAIGLPIFVWGPEYSSAIRWARERPGAAACYTRDSIDPELIQLLVRLRDDAAWREELAQGALAAGEKDFSLIGARQILHDALRQTSRIHNV